MVVGSAGHGGSRRAAPSSRSVDRRALALGLGAAAAALAWVLLVIAAIRFGQTGRGGDGSAWAFMALASLGAVACLFLALMLGWRVAAALGVRSRRPVRSVVAKGGKRARR